MDPTATRSSPTGNATADHEFELTARNVTSDRHIQPDEIEQTNLPKADGGKDAYLFLCGCFMAEAMCWGEWRHYPLTLKY